MHVHVATIWAVEALRSLASTPPFQELLQHSAIRGRRTSNYGSRNSLLVRKPVHNGCEVEREDTDRWLLTVHILYDRLCHVNLTLTLLSLPT